MVTVFDKIKTAYELGEIYEKLISDKLLLFFSTPLAERHEIYRNRGYNPELVDAMISDLKYYQNIVGSVEKIAFEMGHFNAIDVDKVNKRKPAFDFSR